MTIGVGRPKGIRSVARVLVFLLIGSLLFWLAVRGQNLPELRARLAHARWRWAALSLVCAILSNVVRAARWNLLIHPLGDRPRLANTFGAVLVGYMANLALPRLGEVSRCAVLHRYERTPFAALLGTVVSERIIDVVTVLLCLGLLVALAFDRMASMATRFVIDPVVARLEGLMSHDPILLAAIGFAVIVLALVGRIVYTRARGSRYVARAAETLRRFVTGLRTVGRLEERGRFVVYTAAIWLVYVVMAWLCFLCFPATEHLGPTAALAVLVFSGIGFAAPVQGGLGAFELVVTPALVVFGIPAGDALAYAILYHVTQVAGMLVFGLVALAALPLINRESSGAGLDGAAS